MNNSGFRIRVDDDLRSRFIAACKAHDLTAAQVLREFMRTYVDQEVHSGQFDLFNKKIKESEQPTKNYE